MTPPTDLTQALREIIDADMQPVCCNRPERHPDTGEPLGCCGSPEPEPGPCAQIAIAALAAHESRAQPASWPVELQAVGFNDAAAVIGYMDDIDAEVARIAGDEGEDSSLQVLRRMPDYQPAQPASATDDYVAWLRYRHHDGDVTTIHVCDSDDKGAFRVYREPPTQPAITVTDEMVTRFLGWRLPQDFAPGAGVSFKPIPNPLCWPTGTDLLNDPQARAMLEYVLAGTAQPASVAGGYYLASFKHKQPGGYVLWWGPNNCGYTSDLEQAGIYTADQIKAGYHDSEHTIPVPVALIEHLRVRRMVDPGDTLNAPMHNAKALREWLAAASQPAKESDHGN